MVYRCDFVPVRGRVTNGQRAAVCALVLAGVAYGYACNIVGVRHEMMNGYVGPEWRKRIKPRARWTDDQIEELAGYWRDWNMKTATIGNLYGVGADRICKIARDNGLPPRPHGPMPKPKKIVRRQRFRRPPRGTPEFHAYNKLSNLLGAEKAKQGMGL